MNLPRSHSHNGPTNPKNKSQTNPKRKHNSRSKGLRQSAVHQATLPSVWADRPQGGRGPSEGREQTVRQPEPPVMHQEKWTIRDGPADRPPRHRPSDTLVQTVRKLRATKIHWQNGSNERHARTRDEHNEQLGCHAPCGPSVMNPCTVRQKDFEGQPFLPFARSPQSTKGLLPNHRRGWSSLWDAIPTNL
jgi:hypothetical protein